jgi:hypothetical protein
VLGLVLLSFSGGRCRDRTCDPFLSRKFLGFDLVCTAFSVVAVIPTVQAFSTVSCCLALQPFAPIC